MTFPAFVRVVMFPAYVVALVCFVLTQQWAGVLGLTGGFFIGRALRRLR